VEEESIEDRTRDRETFLDNVAQSMTDPQSHKARVAAIHAHPDHTSYGVLEFKDGRVVECYTFPQRVGGETVGTVWSLRDITQRRRLEALLQHYASHDHLTDLLNRRGFEETLQAMLDEPEERHGFGALLLLDLDQFKDINDSLGHPAGDEVLAGLAELLKRSLPLEAIIARVGGDEFGIILPGVGVSRAEVIGRQIAALNRGFPDQAGDSVRVTASASSSTRLMARLW
jgi:diguanylate cyclase (GGDEF)-like protein